LKEIIIYIYKTNKNQFWHQYQVEISFCSERNSNFSLNFISPSFIEEGWLLVIFWPRITPRHHFSLFFQSK